MPFSIAIDGPAGSGKSTIATRLSQKLKFTTINSGNLYRAVTFILEKTFTKYDLNDENIQDFISKLDISMDNGKIFYQKEDITPFLRSQVIDEKSAIIAKVLYVRQNINILQKKLIECCKTGFIIEGRDIGTNVLPDATLKVYIDASAEERARRRYNERPSISFDETLNSIKKRDDDDKSREHGPLVKANDATVIDTTNLTIDDAVETIINVFHNRIK